LVLIFNTVINTVRFKLLFKKGKFNKLHKELMNMFTDASMIFQKDSDMLKYFKFDNVLAVVASHGSAGIKGSVSNGVVPVEEIKGLELSITETGEKFKADKDGNFNINLPVGAYTLNTSAPGHKAYVKSLIVQAGIHTQVTIMLEKEAA
jgi:ammonia channel protein AmtB